MNQDYGVLARDLLNERRRRGLPPAGAMAMLRCDSTDFNQGLAFLSAIKAQLSRDSAIVLIGPIPAAMARRAGRYRAQLLLLSSDRRALHHAATQMAWVADGVKKPGDIKWFMDIDPADSA